MNEKSFGLHRTIRFSGNIFKGTVRENLDSTVLLCKCKGY